MKTILSLLFALISVIALGQTGSINATTIRAKTTDSTSSVVGTGYGGLRFKNQASQLKWQFTNNGTTWYDLPTNPIRGTLSATAIPYALGVYTLGYENALTYDATLNRVNISNPGLTATSYLLGGEIQLDEPGSTDNITLTVGTASDPSITLLDGSNEQMTIQTDNILLNYIGMGDALDIDITGIARTDSSTPGGDLFKISNLSGDLELETSTVSGSDIILDPLDDLDVQADNANFANTISIRGGSPGSGKVLQSDADGDASWFTPPWIDGSGVANNVPYFSDINTVTVDGNFTYNTGTLTAPTLSAGGNIRILNSGYIKSIPANQTFFIEGSDGSDISNNGGVVDILGGAAYSVSGDGNGGAVRISGTNARGSGIGGGVNITAGDGGTRGRIYIEGGASADSDVGGNVEIYSGRSSGGKAGQIILDTDPTIASLPGDILIRNLTTSDPSISNAIWNNNGFVSFSGGMAVLSGSATIDFPSLVDGQCSTSTVTVTGADVGDPVFIGPPNIPSISTAAAFFQAFVSSANTVSIKFCVADPTATVDLGPATYKVIVFDN